MDALAELQRLSLIAKVCAELDNHMGLSDKTLAEFLVHLASDSGSPDAFAAACFFSWFSSTSLAKASQDFFSATGAGGGGAGVGGAAGGTAGGAAAAAAGLGALGAGGCGFDDAPGISDCGLRT